MKKVIAILGMVMVITISAIGVVTMMNNNHDKAKMAGVDATVVAELEKAYAKYANDENLFHKQIARAELSDINAEGCYDNPWYNFEVYDTDGNYIGWGGMHRNCVFELVDF